MTARMSSVYQLRMRTLRRLKSQRILCLGVVSAAVLTLTLTYQSSGSAHVIVMLREVSGGQLEGSILSVFDLLFSSRVTEAFEEKRFQKSHASQRILKTVTDLVYSSSQPRFG